MTSIESKSNEQIREMQWINKMQFVFMGDYILGEISTETQFNW